ncbi:hypothetical protein CM15mP5_1170 [bacterium]|nr:MAG: hypothetical protein CM15mP5_1170 [bacterium]
MKIIYDTAPPPVPENSDAKVSVTGSNFQSVVTSQSLNINN